MSVAKPFDMEQFTEERFLGLDDAQFRVLMKAIDDTALQKLNETMTGLDPSIALATIAAYLAMLISFIAKDCPESTSCNLHENIARFSHTYLHFGLRIAFEQGRYAGPLDRAHGPEDDSDDDTVH